MEIEEIPSERAGRAISIKLPLSPVVCSMCECFMPKFREELDIVLHMTNLCKGRTRSEGESGKHGQDGPLPLHPPPWCLLRGFEGFAAFDVFLENVASYSHTNIKLATYI